MYWQEFVKDELLEPLYLEFVNRVNEVGVDVNRCLTHSHTASLIQFVCGLGPRKGYHLLKVLHLIWLKNFAVSQCSVPAFQYLYRAHSWNTEVACGSFCWNVAVSLCVYTVGCR